jgi:plasmid stabilization system protein ParE
VVSAAVTVERPRAELEGSASLDPLRRLGDAVEVTLRDGPGSWGTEVHASWRRADPREASVALERALREVRQLAETGEVLRNEPRPAGRRRATPGGALVDWAERHSDRVVRLRRLWSRP